MSSKTNGPIQRSGKIKHVQGEGPNWILVAGGALLSTLSIRLVCKLKQTFEIKRHDNAIKGNGKCMGKRRPGACQLHSNLYHFTVDDNSCYYCLSEIAGGGVDIKEAPTSPVLKEADPTLPLVKVPGSGSNKENGVMWTLSPDRLELPRKPLHYSNSSDSPCVSESGSDIYSKREVILKLRQQLKRRDEMIMEMQTQIRDLQNSLSIQVTQSANLQSQLDSANRDLFDSERQIQQLRKILADHCVAETLTPEKLMTTRNWHSEAMNGQVNGYPDSVDDLELHCVGVEKRKGDCERVEMLRREVGELKEVIEGKDFLLQSYKEQKVELSSKIKELQLRLASQVPNIL
ncbi:uncharacterized protein [Typha latifolia]|uniref:uncharacterized protein n=1 Tax=Typha latifolia TaxID=4733 RepID=UPI003C2DCC60